MSQQSLNTPALVFFIMKYLSLIVISLLILAACAAPEPNKAKQLTDDIKKQAEEPKTEATTPPSESNETSPVAQEAISAPTPDEDLQKTLTETVKEVTAGNATRTKMYDFLDTFAKNVRSYQFKYKGTEYYVKGTRFKIILDAPVIVKNVKFGEMQKQFFYYDTIYVDRAAKTAIAFCEGHKSPVNSQCYDLKLYDLAYPVPIKEYDVILPEDWLFANLNNEPNQIEANKYYIKGRASIFVRFETDPALELNIDPSTGLIMQADLKKGSQLVSRNEYLDLVSNEVRDVDVQHRSREEIPTSEAFYR